MTNISINNLNEYDIWQKLDAKDGSDGKITKNIWDEFRNVIGMGNTINNYITEQNALKSIKYYLKNISEEVAQKLANYIGISSSDEKLTPIEPQDEVEEPIENNPPRDTLMLQTHIILLIKQMVLLTRLFSNLPEIVGY